jgi:hypothetical protein
MAMDIQMPPLALDILTGMVELAAQKGEIEQALELSAFVLHHPATEQQIKDRLEPLCAELVTQVPQQVAASAQTRGQTLELDMVAAEILRDAPHPPV